MSKPLLITEDLNSYYGDFQALYNVNVKVMKDEVVAIIGANGAGKTTLLKSIAGLIENRPDQITFKDEIIGSTRPDKVAKNGIALVPEGRQLFPSLSVEENLLIGGQLNRPGPWSLHRVFDIFPILKERRNQASTELSGGQQQMVAIGRALMANPDLLLLDEISLGLAPVIIKSIYETLPDIIGNGISAVIVEQDISRALAVSHRAYCFQEGRVSLEGKSGEMSRIDISRAYFGV
ncbi:MAG: ABC transporter ATP-binding protein [Proteobacteria bacterium]|nr:ABC transporter ATP-binding protein [Pseudomonadota bacterium]